LTFVPAADDPAQNDDTKAGYQGVFFKWGSLVGISPVGNYSGSTAIYVPIVRSPLNTSTWKATTGLTIGGDTDFPTVSGSWAGWQNPSAGNAAPATNIPYMDGSYAKSGETIYSRDNTYAIDAERNDLTTYQGFRGDICQYLSKTQSALDGYRLPTSDEFGTYTTDSWAASNPTSTPNSDGWIKGIDPFPSLNNSAGKVNGRANMLIAAENNGNTVYGSAINRLMGDVVFPASGYYLESGTLDYVGATGTYWSCSASSATNGFNWSCGDSNVRPTYTGYRSLARPVRCIKN
jgi:hypothetical protein